MLQLIRSLENNFRNFVRSLRQSPRYNPRLPFTLSMMDGQPDAKGLRPALMLRGHTRNLSETGMALVVPAIRKGDYHLAAINRRLLIVLELPSGPIRLQAAPVRYQQSSRNETGYLIGVRIVSMSDDDKLRFHRFLYRLSRGAQISSRRANAS